MKTTICKHLKLRDVADLLDVHQRTVQREIYRGNLLPVVEISGEIRVPITTLRDYLRERTIKKIEA